MSDTQDRRGIGLFAVLAAGLLAPPALAQTEVTAVEVTPDGRTAITAGLDGKVRFWDVATRKQRQVVIAHPAGVCDLALSADGKRFITAGGDRTVRVWDVENGKEIRTLGENEVEVAAVALSPDGQLAAVGGYDPVIRLWDVRTGKLRHRLDGHELRVTALAFAPDGKKLASGGIGKATLGRRRSTTQADRVRLWDVATGAGEVLPIRGQRVLFTPDGRHVAAAGTYVEFKPAGGARMAMSEGSRTEVWDLARGRVAATFSERHTGLAVSGNGKYLATAWGHNRHSGGRSNGPGDTVGVHLVELATGKEVKRVEVPQDDAIALALTPDARTAVTGRADGKVDFHDLHSGAWAPGTWSDHRAEGAWRALAGDDAAEAYQAVWDLSAAGDAAVGWIRKRIRPASLTAEQVRRLIAELDSDDGAARKKARLELARLGEQVEAQLEEALKKTKSAEVRRSVRALLAQLERGPSAEGLRAGRAVVVLERVGTRAAREVLRALAGGTPGLPLTEDAKRALARLDRAAR